MQYLFLLYGVVGWCFISTSLVTAFVLPYQEHKNFAKNPNQQVIVCNRAVLFATTTDDIVIEGSEKTQDNR